MAAQEVPSLLVAGLWHLASELSLDERGLSSFSVQPCIGRVTNTVTSLVLDTCQEKSGMAIRQIGNLDMHIHL